MPLSNVQSKTSSSLEYFAERHRSLAESYSVDCLVIARELAKRLLREGKQPYIATMVRLEQWKQGAFYGPIIPVRYSGRVTFTRHYVCCCDGLAYDPLLEKPAVLDEYSLQAFAMNIPIQTFIPPEGMQEYLAKAVGYARI
ncbi:MAG TPA: hypothetical protein VFC63_28160 [Blastocatellia bacterium]|nr:hypothetical protein [Blastocatellia bacterium]